MRLMLLCWRMMSWLWMAGIIVPVKRWQVDADRMTADKGASKCELKQHLICIALESNTGVNRLYLRLFYTEQYLGWNSEEWPIYLRASILVITLIACILVGTRHYRSKTGSILPTDLVILLCLLCAPLLIALFFAAGRVTTLPIPPGVHEMPKFGCCSQSLVFPQSRIPDLIHLYETKRIGVRGYADGGVRELE